jgi:hypothetical protein
VAQTGCKVCTEDEGSQVHRNIDPKAVRGAYDIPHHKYEAPSGEPDFLQTLDERSDGIGAADGDKLLRGNEDYSWYDEAGAMYAEARHFANFHRSRAFDALPDFGTPRGTALDYHPENGAHVTERALGCPVQWAVR